MKKVFKFEFFILKFKHPRMILLNKFMARKDIVIPSEYRTYMRYILGPYEIDVIPRTKKITNLYYKKYHIYNHSYAFKTCLANRVRFIFSKDGLGSRIKSRLTIEICNRTWQFTDIYMYHVDRKLFMKKYKKSYNELKLSKKN